MNELCREVFEKHQAKLLNMDYKELKDQFDRHEKCFRKRYAAFSDFEKEFELWQAAWNVRQIEINQLKAQIIDQGQRFNDQNQKNADLEYKYLQVQKRVDAALENISGEIAQCHVTEHNRNTTVGQKNTAFLIREKLQVTEEVLRGEHESNKNSL